MYVNVIESTLFSNSLIGTKSCDEKLPPPPPPNFFFENISSRPFSVSTEKVVFTRCLCPFKLFLFLNTMDNTFD